MDAVDDDHGLLQASLGEAARLLDVDRRAWILGVGHLRDVDPARPMPPLDRFGAVFAWAREQGLFPTGALNYVGDAEASLLAQDIATLTFRHKDDRGDDYLEVMVGVGIAGFFAVGMTRTGNLGSETGRPADVIVTDVEAACADLAVVGTLAGQMLHYEGPVDMALSISDEVPGHPLRMRSFDEAGELRPGRADEDAPFRFVSGSIDLRTPVRARFEAVHRMLMEAIAQFDSPLPEFVTTPANALDFQALEQQYSLPDDLRC